jgi:hypothetical protein
VATPVPIDLRRLAVAVAVVLAAGRVRAETPRASLVVTRGPGAEDCPDVAAITARVRALTASDALDPRPDAPRDTWIQVELLRVLPGYRAVLSARGKRQGTRTIEDVGPSCRSLGEAVSITLVMLLDPALAESPPAELRTEPARASPPQPQEPSRPHRAWALGAEASGGAALAVLRHPAPFVELGPRIRFARHGHASAGGGLVFPDRFEVVEHTVQLSLWYGYARASWLLFDRDGSELALVAGMSAGSLLGRGDGFETYHARSLLWLAGAAGAELDAALSSALLLSARVLLLAPLIHEGFRVSVGGSPHSAFDTPPLGGALSLGLVAEL